MPSTRAISITALIMSLVALIFALTDFSKTDLDPVSTTAAILLPAQTLAQSLNHPAMHSVDAASSYWFTDKRGVETTYTHPQTGLTFAYPSDFNLYVAEEDGGEVIVGEKSEYGLAFQIFIQPWGEPGPLTIERIRRDLPDMVMENVVVSELYRTAEPLVRFQGFDDTLGYIPEAWFVHDGYLYQVAFYAPPEDDPNPLSAALFRGFLQSLTFTTPSS